MYFQTGVSENGTIHITMIKTGSVIDFFLEKGAYSISGSREKGGYSGRTYILSYKGCPPPPACLQQLHYYNPLEVIQ